MKLAELSEIEVIFTGAGASVAPPSRLPAGRELGLVAIEAFIHALDGRLRGRAAAVRDAVTVPTGVDRDGVRLEELMELLGETAQRRPLTEIYDLLESDAFNQLHLLIAETGLPVVTVNMDTLQERAAKHVALAEHRAPTRVDHLHGRWGDDETISTTISRYQNGLRGSEEKAFADAIEGRSVLIVGWAGRDWDITQAFIKHPPSRLLWLEHPNQSIENQQPTLDALRLLSTLNANAGNEIARWRLADGRKELIEALGHEPDLPHNQSAAQPKKGRQGVPVRAIETLRSTPQLQIAYGLARTLIAVGRPRDAAKLLTKYERVFETLPNAEAKTLARAYRAAGRPEDAFRVLLRPWRTFRWRTGMTNLNEIAATLSRLGRPRSAIALNVILARIARARGDQRREVTARTRNAQLLAAAGHVGFAAREFTELLPAEALRGSPLLDIGIGNYVDSATWAADTFKMAGDYQRALNVIRSALPMAPYSSPTQLAYAMWKEAEILLLAGAAHAEVRERLAGAEAAAQRAGDPIVSGWIDCTFADLLRRTDPNAAAKHLRAARDAARKDHFLGLFHHLQEAELARENGRFRRSAKLIRTLKATAGDRRKTPLGNPTAILAADFALAKTLLQKGHRRRARHLLAKLERAYQRRGMVHARQRCEQLRRTSPGRTPYLPVIMWRYVVGNPR